VVEIRKYVDEQGRAPFDDWLEGVKDQRARARILTRIDRVPMGNEGDWKPIKASGGVRELRIPEGKGYRVYYAWDGETAILLLCGGNKSSQSADAKLAGDYWRNWRKMHD